MKKLKGVIKIYDDTAVFHHVENGEEGPPQNISMSKINDVLKKDLNALNIDLLSWENLIPANILHFDSATRNLMFYTEPTFRKLQFDIKDDEE